MAKSKMINTEEIVKAREKGMDYISIAKFFNISKKTVSYHLKKAGFQNGLRMTNHKMNIFAHLKEILENYLNGKLSLEKISLKYKVNRFRLTILLRENGITIRDNNTTRRYLRELGLYKKLEIKGQKNPNFKHGRYCGLKKNRISQYHTFKYRLWRNAVLKRDNFKCVECGNSEKLNSHHIEPIRKNIEKFYDVNNGIILCEKCHSKTYFKENLFKNRFSALIQNTAKAGV